MSGAGSAVGQGDVRQRLCEELARRSDTRAEDWHLTYRARHGMLVAFRALREACGAGSVVTQLLTCCTAVDPVVAAGLVPVYGDVGEGSWSLDPAALPACDDLRAVVCQHTFGYIDEASSQALAASAHEQGALLVEDCAHCVGRMATGEDDRPLADVSIHSFGVEKMLPTYFGGAVWVNPSMEDAALHDALVAALDALPEPPAALEKATQSYRNQIRTLNHLPRGLAHPLRSKLIASGRFDPAIWPEEQAGGVHHEPMTCGAFSAEQALGALQSLDASLDARVACLAAYAEEFVSLDGLSVQVPAAMLASAQPLLRLGVRLSDDATADIALADLRAQGVYVVPWYRPFLFPGVSDLAAYHAEGVAETLPVTYRLSQGTLALPCDLSADQARQVVDTLAKAGAR